MTLRRKNTAKDFPLDIRQLLEIGMGPKPSGSAFASEDELREAWEANREKTLHRYAFTLHNAGWRPEAYWFLECGDPGLAYDYNAPNGNGTERLRWLWEHEAFLAGELEAMRSRAHRDPNGYAAAAWALILEWRAEDR
jgi:hypothetical protein